MFDYVFQIREIMLFRIFDAMRAAAVPILPQTPTDGIPFDLGGGITVSAVLNIPDEPFPLTLDESRQTVRILLADLPLQLLVVGGVADGDVLFETEISYLLDLPLGTDLAEDRVRVGIDPAAFGDDAILATLADGHPLSDDAVLIDLLDRELHNLLTGGGFPTVREVEDEPLSGTPFEVSAFIWLNDSIMTPTDLSARVEPSGRPGPWFRFVMPTEFGLIIKIAGTDVVVHSVTALAEITAEIPVIRDLNPDGNAPATVTVQMSQAETEIQVQQILTGDDITNFPDIWDQIQDFIRDQVQTALVDLEDQTIPTMSLRAIIARMQDIMRNALSVDRDDDGTPDFIPLWETARNQEVASAQAAIINNTLTIGINGTDDSDVTNEVVFIPPDRDFAVRVDGTALLTEISAVLVTPEEYDDIDGKLSSAIFQGEAENPIAIQGFAAEEGTIKARTRLRIEGFMYTVTEDAEIERLPDEFPVPGDQDEYDDPAVEQAQHRKRNRAGVILDRRLQSSLPRDTRIYPQFGVGLPITENIDFPGWSFRVNDDITPTLKDGFLRLAGRGRLQRTLFSDIGVDLDIRLAMDWASTAQVRGGGQTGDSVNVTTVSETLRAYPENSRLIIDDFRDMFRITATAEPSGDEGNATLNLSRALDQSPDDNGMAALRWLAIGRVSDGPQLAETLRIIDMREGAGAIPSGAFVRIDGNKFVLDEDADIVADQTATLKLKKRIDSLIPGGPASGTAISFGGGWNGKGRIAGEGQESGTLEVAGLVRTVPSGTPLSIDGIAGSFKVVNANNPDGTPGDDVEIVANAATVKLRHPATDEIRQMVPALSDEDLIWTLFGQPEAEAAVTRGTGGQSPTVRRVGNVDVSLDSPLDGVIGAIVGFFTGLILPGSVFSKIIVGAIVGVIVRNAFRRKLQAESNDFELGDVIDLPIEDQLDALGIFLSPTLNNPITITPGGLIFAGQANPVSGYPEVTEQRASTPSDYTFDAGVSGQFMGSGPAPASIPGWQTGDGASLNGSTPSHTYQRRGTYVARFSGVDTQLIAERHTQKLARVTVRNTPPVLGPLPVLTGLEGDEIVLTASFSDIAFTDGHRAIVHWGDATLPEFAEVTETIGPPRTIGQITARHHYCDNGTFTVTLIVEDAQGGTERRETRAEIENVPPFVKAGPDVYAHPCVPTRLVGHFTDPGWCDRHMAIWDFGDCTEPFAATIFETHKAPEGRGTATATHCYDGCGTWQARLTVTDDDGGIGTDTLIVTHSSLHNGDFEDGFARHRLGAVGRHWQPYARVASSVPPANPVFGCEDCVVFDGDSAQSMMGLGYDYAGIRQSFGANPGWEYQITARLSVQGAGTTGWVGIDPMGGEDRTSPSVVWRGLSSADGWQGISTLAVAEADRVTVFVEVRTPEREPFIIDSVEMQAWPCAPDPAPECPPDKELKDPETFCVDLTDLLPGGTLGTRLDLAGFGIVAASGGALRTVTFGAPAGARKLLIPDDDIPDRLVVTLPFQARSAEATVSGSPAEGVTLRALSAGGGILDSSDNSAGGIRVLTVEAHGIATLEITSSRRGTLHRLCIDPDLNLSGPGDITTSMQGTKPGRT